MSKRIEFYKIFLKTDSGISDYNINFFLNDLNDQMHTDEKRNHFVREVSGKYIRFFPYIKSITGRQYVIPFGKLKNKNKPYWINDEENLEEIPKDLYDINSVGYDCDYDVMLLTTNREGPNFLNIEEYLNTFIPSATGLSVKIEPIMYNSGIEKVRNANFVRKVVLNLNLGYSLNHFYLKQITKRDEFKVISILKNLAETTKNECDGKTLSITIGLGHDGKKDATLNLDSMLGLLNSINVDEEFVSEIVVYYKDGTDEKIETAKLKKESMILSYNCVSDNNQISPSALLENINNAVAEKIISITRYVPLEGQDIISYDGDKIELKILQNE